MFACAQKPDEKIDAYSNEFRTKAKTCEFRDLTGSLIRDKIVCGLTYSTVRAGLRFAKGNFNLSSSRTCK